MSDQSDNHRFLLSYTKSTNQLITPPNSCDMTHPSFCLHGLNIRQYSSTQTAASVSQQPSTLSIHDPSDPWSHSAIFPQFIRLISHRSTALSFHSLTSPYTYRLSHPNITSPSNIELPNTVRPHMVLPTSTFPPHHTIILPSAISPHHITSHRSIDIIHQPTTQYPPP